MNILNLMQFNANLQVAHWQAPTKTNEHSALGELYEKMIDLTDEFVETYFGTVGSRELETGEDGEMEIEIVQNMEPLLVIQGGLSVIDELKSALSEDSDDLLNILADMRGALNKTLYKLQDV